MARYRFFFFFFFFFLSFLLAEKCTPGRVLMLAVALGVPNANNIRWFRTKLPMITAFGLTLLKVPTDYGIVICTRFFFVTFVQVTVNCSFKFDMLYALLMAPIWLVCTVGEIVNQTDPFLNPIMFLKFLGFLEGIVNDPHVKTFVLTHAREDFWMVLNNAVRCGLDLMNGKLMGRVFRILARLSDFSCSLKPSCTGGQRIIFDCLSHPIVTCFVGPVEPMLDGGFKPPESGVLAVAALEILLAFCDPPVPAAFVWVSAWHSSS
jgi:hypothetical protein